MDTGNKIREVRQEYKEYLIEKHPDWSESTVNTHVSDASFIWNNTVIPGFWKVFVSDETMEMAREAIRNFLKNETKSEAYEERTKGYYNDPEKTKEAFIQNPLNPYYSDIIYRTGDVGVIKEDGYIYFKARKDSQIKHMGYRIELGEIETAINSCDAIKEAICFYDDDAKKIVCVYEGDLADADLIKYIENILPKYMYPNVFKNITKMPHNANGKIDRVKLKEIYFDEKNK